MGNIGGHDRRFTCVHPHRLPADHQFHSAVEHMHQSIERRGMLAELLALIEREEGDCAGWFVENGLAHYRAISVLDGSGERYGLRMFDSLAHIWLQSMMTTGYTRVNALDMMVTSRLSYNNRMDGSRFDHIYNSIIKGNGSEMTNQTISPETIRSISDEATSELAAVAEHAREAASPAAFRQNLHEYRSIVARYMERAQRYHEAGSPGRDVCTLISAIVDRIVGHAFHEAFPVDESESGYTVIAMGGYGRREMNPLSDIDLLFVTGGPFAERFEEYVSDMLKFLWDLNLDLGHSTRTIDECIGMAGEDTHFATSLLEGRYLAGNERVWRRLSDTYTSWLAGEAGARILQGKIMERNRRIEGFAGAVQVQIPNVKESPGALRDIQFMRWTLLLTGRGSSLDDLHGTGLFTDKDITGLTAAFDFLLRMRNGLHFVTGRKSDILDHLVLPELATNLGYSGEGNEPVEHLMREYYMHAGRVRRFSDRLADIVTLSPEASSTESPVLNAVSGSAGRLVVPDDAVEECVSHPERIIRIVMDAASAGGTVSGGTALAIEQHCEVLGPDFPKLPEVQRAFHDLVNMPSGISRAFRFLHEFGLLVRLIPELHEISWHYQYDFYHMYTTDEHSIRVVENLDNMAAGRSGSGEFQDLMADVPARGALMLAGLLHDVGKREGRGHAHRGEQMATRALNRLGFDRRTVELVRFLIREHLLMSHTSQRRDIDDPETITDLASRIGSAGRLRMLTLLTFADLMALSPGALTEWKKALLWSLYDKALAAIETGYEEQMPAARKRNVEVITTSLGSKVDSAALAAHLDMLPDQYMRVTRLQSIRTHLAAVERLKRQNVWASFHRRGNITLLMVVTRDYPHALSDICGTITSSGINIIGARIFTRTDGVIIDTFLVVDNEGNALIPAESQREFKRDIKEVIGGGIVVDKLISDYRRRWRRVRRKAVYAPPRVRMLNDVSSRYTVIDVFATDYTGLLYDITSVLAVHDIDIHTARIGTDEDQVADAFYVQRRGGGKIEDAAELERIQTAIIGKLGEAAGG